MFLNQLDSAPYLQNYYFKIPRVNHINIIIIILIIHY